MANNERVELSRRPDETFDDFALRLYANSRQYGVNCYRIAEILNQESGLHKAENSWRIRYKDFRRGMEYQKFNDDQEAMVGERILCVSDLHYPFNLPLDIFTDYVGGIDTFVLNGDLLDCMALSRFQKSYRISPIEEIIGCRQYLIDLIKMLKPARVIATNGNHEYRLSTYINKNIDCEIKELMPDSPLEYLFEDGFTHYDKANAAKTYYPPLKDVFRDIDFRYTHGWWYQYGGIIFCHPKAFSSGILKTSEKALMWFRNNGNIFDALVMAHTHRIGMYKIGGTMLYEQGCCCDTAKMQYSDGMLVNSQKEGFLYLTRDREGNFKEETTKLVFLN